MCSTSCAINDDRAKQKAKKVCWLSWTIPWTLKSTRPDETKQLYENAIQIPAYTSLSGSPKPQARARWHHRLNKTFDCLSQGYAASASAGQHDSHMVISMTVTGDAASASAGQQCIAAPASAWISNLIPPHPRRQLPHLRVVDSMPVARWWFSRVVVWVATRRWATTH